MPMCKTSIAGVAYYRGVLNSIAGGSKSRFERRENEDRPTVIVMVFYLYDGSECVKELYFEWVKNTDLVFYFFCIFI